MNSKGYDSFVNTTMLFLILLRTPKQFELKNFSKIKFKTN